MFFQYGAKIFIISGLFLGVGVTAYFDKHRLADIGRRKRGHRKMKKDSPFYSVCFNVLRLSPLFSNLDEKTFQDMLLQFHRETWMKNSPAMDSDQIIERFYVIISGRMNVCRINPSTCCEKTIFL